MGFPLAFMPEIDFPLVLRLPNDKKFKPYVKIGFILALFAVDFL